MTSSPHSRPTAEESDRPSGTVPKTPARRTLLQRSVDAILFSAVAAGVVLTVSRFLQSVSTSEPAPVAPGVSEPIQEAVLSVTGWQVFQRTEPRYGPPSIRPRLERLRELARRASSATLPLAADSIETGFQRAALDWAVRERVGMAEIRDTGAVPGTGAVFLHDPADPNGERVLAWYAELPLASGEIRVIETVRADLADGRSAASPFPSLPPESSE